MQRIILVFLFAFLAHGTVHAQRTSGSFGIGGQVGSPSGVTVKLYNANSYSWDFLAAWDVDDLFFLNLHAIYERPAGGEPNLRLFYGPGAFVGVRDQGRDDDDDVELGISGTVGLSYLIERFELYFAVTPRLALVPATDGDVGAGIGVRYYF